MHPVDDSAGPRAGPGGRPGTGSREISARLRALDGNLSSWVSRVLRFPTSVMGAIVPEPTCNARGRLRDGKSEGAAQWTGVLIGCPRVRGLHGVDVV